MSGGHFGPSIKYRLEEINDELQRIIDINDSDERDEYGDLKSRQLGKSSIRILRGIIVQNEFTWKLFHAVDYLLSGDHGETELANEFQSALDVLSKKIDNL